MTMINRLKYLILRALLGDICKRSSCDDCMLTCRVEIADYVGTGCEENDILYQARKVWKVE